MLRLYKNSLCKSNTSPEWPLFQRSAIPRGIGLVRDRVCVLHYTSTFEIVAHRNIGHESYKVEYRLQEHYR